MNTDNNGYDGKRFARQKPRPNFLELLNLLLACLNSLACWSTQFASQTKRFNGIN